MPYQPLRPEDIYDELRRGILGILKQYSAAPSKFRTLQVRSDDIRSLTPQRQIQERDKPVLDALKCQILHELYLERIIVPGSGNLDSTGPVEWPSFRITDHGREVLQTQEYSPYDPDGYLRRLKSEIPNVDETILRYLDESLRSLRADCLLAAAVTVGCAAEKTMLLLIDRFGQAISDHAKRRNYEARTAVLTISKKYERFRKSFDIIAVVLPRTLSQWESHLDGTFNLIRAVRNAAGHPSGEPITREMVIANQTIFPGYCKYVYRLIAHLADNPVCLP